MYTSSDFEKEYDIRKQHTQFYRSIITIPDVEGLDEGSVQPERKMGARAKRVSIGKENETEVFFSHWFFGTLCKVCSKQNVRGANVLGASAWRAPFMNS